MKLFTTRQIAEIDRFTIENEPVAAIDLMERASRQVADWLGNNFSSDKGFIVFAGPGNNGGDALAVSRLLAIRGYRVEVYVASGGKELKGPPAVNLQRLKVLGSVKIISLDSEKDFPVIDPADIIIDGLFGSGLSRALEGLALRIVERMNSLPNLKVAIDMPSGLMGESNSGNAQGGIVKAGYTLTFEFPKISFLLSGNEHYTGKWEVLPIDLHPEGKERVQSDYYFLEKKDVKEIFPARGRFSHKGTFGHALLIAGSYGKIGAAVLASRACLRAGAGLLTTHVPHFGYTVLQTAVPEAMVSVDAHDSIFTDFPDVSQFTAVGVGPGLGKKSNTCKAFHELLVASYAPLVLDADAINILSENKDWLKELPANSILTPHPGEFKRLAGETAGQWEQIQRQRELAGKYNIIIVLKGAYTTVALPDGKIFFNSTGNPGMATAGSGDVLTGFITGLLAQKMPPHHAAIAGVYLHGLAGDLAAGKKSENAMVAGDIIEALGDAFLEIL